MTPGQIDEPGLGRLEVWELEPTEERLRPLLIELFERHWPALTFGPLIQGSAWEIRGKLRLARWRESHATTWEAPWASARPRASWSA